MKNIFAIVFVCTLFNFSQASDHKIAAKNTALKKDFKGAAWQNKIDWAAHFDNAFDPSLFDTPVSPSLAKPKLKRARPYRSIDATGYEPAVEVDETSFENDLEDLPQDDYQGNDKKRALTVLSKAQRLSRLAHYPKQSGMPQHLVNLKRHMERGAAKKQFKNSTYMRAAKLLAQKS